MNAYTKQVSRYDADCTIDSQVHTNAWTNDEVLAAILFRSITVTNTGEALIFGHNVIHRPMPRWITLYIRPHSLSHDRHMQRYTCGRISKAWLPEQSGTVSHYEHGPKLLLAAEYIYQ